MAITYRKGLAYIQIRILMTADGREITAVVHATVTNENANKDIYTYITNYVQLITNLPLIYERCTLSPTMFSTYNRH